MCHDACCWGMGRGLLLSILFVLPTTALSTTALIAGDDAVERSSLAQALTKVLTAQSTAWNQGDIDAFMEHYWKSEQLTFSSGGETTRGWLATITRYKKRYTSQAKMGRLTFDHLEFTPLGEASALVLGQWHLKRTLGDLGGNFSLVMRRIEGKWLIIHDHTSSLAKPVDP